MSRPWMPLYVADYLRDTRKLTPAEHGAYLLLIMEYWTSGGLPGDDRQLARVVGMSPAEWRKAKPNVQGFFGNDWKSHKRIDTELAKSAEISSKRSASAKQKHSNSSANAQQEHTHAGATSQPQPQSQERPALRADTRAGGRDAPSTKPKKRAIALPESWKPSLKSYEIAEQFGQNVQIVEGIFRDYVASSGKLYADHDAAFHNFIRNQNSFNRGATNGVRQPENRGSIVNAADRAIANLEREIAADHEAREGIVLSLPAQRLR